MNYIIPVTRQNCENLILENADNQLIYNVSSYGVKNHIVVDNSSENVVAVNIAADNLYKANDANEESGALVLVDGGSITIVNSLRYNGLAYRYNSGVLRLYNHINYHTIEEYDVVKK